MAQVNALYRHPIKAHGRESLQTVRLTAGETFPWDRVWAVAHDAAKIAPTNTGWAACQNFSRGAKAPALMAINAKVDEATNTVHLTHPERPDLTINPDNPQDSAKLLEWTNGLVPQDRAQSAFITKADRAMTDTDYGSISIINLASNSAVSTAANADVSPLRWRGNIWLDGLEPWEEFDWVGRNLRIGKAILEIREPIVRCTATMANPETGQIDIDTLHQLKANWGHQNFGVYAVVIESGEINLNDTVELV